YQHRYFPPRLETGARGSLFWSEYLVVIDLEKDHVPPVGSGPDEFPRALASDEKRDNFDGIGLWRARDHRGCGVRDVVSPSILTRDVVWLAIACFSQIVV
ncbi:hypothetical protein, partial [Bradyrhizobium sp.]|uniref:hypothetical protein n=1 Tax=Bradyrhizobium sp. TaxID=376 RepID=UPI0025C01CEB